MNQELLQRVVEEIRSEAPQNFLGKIFQLSQFSFAMDLGIRGRLLFLSVEPSSPRLYLIRRKIKDLEKASIPLSPFGQLLRSQLGGGEMLSGEKLPDERIVKFTFRIADETGHSHVRYLIAQLTGRSANLLILDESNRISGALRSPKGPGQNLAETYLPPPRQETVVGEVPFSIGPSPSDAADEYFQALDKTKAFDLAVRNAKTAVQKLKTSKLKLQHNLKQDLIQHGDPTIHKRMGDLLLANLATAVRCGDTVEITDFYTTDAPTIEIEVEQNKSLQEAAAESFRKYTKAKRAREEIANRLKSLDSELHTITQREQELDRIQHERDELALANLMRPGESGRKPVAAKRKNEQPLRGVRRYLSTDGYEILVGRAAKDNDNLTFRIARPNDIWLHAGDYPGSHVVIRNPTRKEVPQRTVIEAAQLAGKFSQASDDAKVVIHYTERKFLSKPKGSAPGLVRMSSFRSITVAPQESIPRIESQ
jgi:predicted ribosome quality control (RQC) complex YloA/Tae2 family protein